VGEAASKSGAKIGKRIVHSALRTGESEAHRMP
jgi:hypothetical protein